MRSSGFQPSGLFCFMALLAQTPCGPEDSSLQPFGLPDFFGRFPGAALNATSRGEVALS